MRNYRMAFGTAALLASVSAATFAEATTLGKVWEVPSSVASDAVPGNVPGTPPTVTFSIPTSPLDMNSNGSTDYTIGSFIGSGGGTILTGGSHAGDSLDNTLFEFLGTVTVTHDEKFSAGHDDGLTLLIAGIPVISAPGGTSFTLTTSTYTGPSGNQPFELVYGECCGAPAVLQVDLPLTSGIPEPSTWAMMLAGFGGLGFAALRRSRKGNVSLLA